MGSARREYIAGQIDALSKLKEYIEPIRDYNVRVKFYHNYDPSSSSQALNKCIDKIDSEIEKLESEI